MHTALNGVTTGEFLRFMKDRSRNTVIHNSNVFFRDIQYGVTAFVESKGGRISYREAEKAADSLVQRLVSEGVLREIDRQSWRVDYPEFALPRVEKTPPAAKAPAAGTSPAVPPVPAAATATPVK